MAPVPLEHPINYMPVAATALHLILIAYLIATVGASLYHSSKSLGPAQDTRHRLARRKKLAPLFLALAICSFAFAVYSSTNYVSLSYRVWADQRGVELPWYLRDGYQTSAASDYTVKLHVAEWLNDTPIYYDAYEIIAEKARRFWWAQHIELATVSWSLLLAIEGRRRNIPSLPGFMALAHLVSLSFAQNLFYLALLFTPAPILATNAPSVTGPRSILARVTNVIMPPKPPNWCPHPLLFLTTLIISYGAIFFLPYTAGTSSFVNALIVARLATFLPVLLPGLTPVSWGTVHPHPHNAYSRFTALFQVVSAVSFALHIKATVVGLFFNTPNSHYHRHSVLFPWDIEQRSTWERSTTAMGKVLGSTADHPVVASVGWDVLFCTLSLGLWAAVRATQVQDILLSFIPFYKPTASALPTVEDMAAVAVKSEAEPEEKDQTEPPSKRGRKGTASRRPVTVGTSSGVDSENASSTKRRGRSKRSRLDEGETVYEPTASEASETVEGDVLPPEELDWEAAALAWGLTAFAGLGSASAGVFGGECISR